MDTPVNLLRVLIELVVDYKGTERKIQTIKKVPEIIDKINNK